MSGWAGGRVARNVDRWHTGTHTHTHIIEFGKNEVASLCVAPIYAKKNDQLTKRQRNHEVCSRFVDILQIDRVFFRENMRLPTATPMLSPPTHSLTSSPNPLLTNILCVVFP